MLESGDRIGRQGSQNYWFMGCGRKLVDKEGKPMMPLVDDKWEVFKGEIEGEIWKEVEIESTEKYEISNFGRIKREGEFCNIKHGNGYRKDIYVILYHVKMYWHIEERLCNLVAKAFVENVEGKSYVRHKDGNIYNNNAENLEWTEEREIDNYKRERKLKLSEVVKLLEKEEKVRRVGEEDNYYSIKDGKIVDADGREIELVDDGGWEKYVGDMRGEVWKKTKLNEDYEVSNYGRVRFNKLEKTFLVNPTLERYQGLTASIYNKEVGRFFSYCIDDIVVRAFYDNVPKRKIKVIHKDGDIKNNYVNNLKWKVKS